ncbi:HI1506-related protein [Providencia rettgeri]|uniref:HI1506-related protein n=1 Tax=Providencia rettgeri TaxID=587 RepID=UPI00206CF9B9|nr:HI1506-related protein [Providencia rettgeri]UPQ37745.1 HI1506-related protein [Providencia rettgeri]
MPIIITAKVNGFRRCGIAHSDAATEYPDDHFTKEQLATLQAESMLVVSVGNNDTAQKSTDAGADKQIAALKAEVKRLTGENESLRAELALLNVTDTVPSDDKKSDDKPETKGK